MHSGNHKSIVHENIKSFGWEASENMTAVLSTRGIPEVSEIVTLD